MSSRRRAGAALLFAACIASAVAVDVLAAACSVAPLDEIGKACMGDTCPNGLPCVNSVCVASADATGPDGPAACNPPSGGDPCASIPRLNGTQTVDCQPTEFCGVPMLKFEAPSGGPTPANVSLQVAWSDEGLHVFAMVRKWPIAPNAADWAELYSGDAIELFGAASSAYLQGLRSDDAYHFVAAAPPPPSTVPGGEGAFFEVNEGQNTDLVPPGTIYEGCVVPDAGYDIEVEMPWMPPWPPGLPATPAPAPGSRIGFDFAVDVQRSDVDAGPVQTFEYQGPLPDSGVESGCVPIGEPEAPYCDDRSYCRPTLQ